MDFSSLLDSMRQTGGEGMTAEEIAEQAGISAVTVRKLLAKAKELGLVSRTTKRMQCIDETWRPRPAYVIRESETGLG